MLSFSKRSGGVEPLIHPRDRRTGLSYSILAMIHAIADDLLTSTLLEATCPLVLAPSMHTGMWEHPAT